MNMFGYGDGHLPEEADRIARRYGAALVNTYKDSDSCGYNCPPSTCPESKVHWFEAPDTGRNNGDDVLSAVEAGLKAKSLWSLS